MSASKLNISEKLIDDYFKVLLSLKEQAVTKLAIQICQNNELKKDIIYESETLRWRKYGVTYVEWENIIVKRSTNICKGLPLPPAIKNLLIIRIVLIALQLFHWNRQQVMLDFSSLFADSFLTPFDWTTEMRLDERMVAERLVQDERIPISQRYKMACLHCLPLFIYSLWDQMSPENREVFFYFEESKLVQLWSYNSAGRLEELIRSKDQFWFRLLEFGVNEGSKSTVFQCWKEFPVRVRQIILVETAVNTILMIVNKRLIEKSSDYMYLEQLLTPPYIDILFFLLMQMSKTQMVTFFQKALAIDNYILQYFTRWPYLDLLLPTIKKLWKFLPEGSYEQLLSVLSLHCRRNHFKYAKIGGNVDYDYGSAMIEILEETPDRFKRYAFSNYHRNTHPNVKRQILLNVIGKKPLQIRNIKIFQRLLRHVTLKEKISFLKSQDGVYFCCHLALQEQWDLLNSILRECLSEQDLAIFKKHILRSKTGKVACFDMLANGNEEALKSWLNWGFPSKQEIFQFILKLFFRNKWFRFKEISDVGIEINCLENVIKIYATSEDARIKFKTRFVKKHARDVCAHFVFDSKWQEMDSFLSWCFLSEGDRKRFKTWFVREYAMFFCEHHLGHSNLQGAEQFLTWCFPSEEALVQFRQELLFFSGVKLQYIVCWLNSRDLDMLIKWFRLSPEAILKFKKEVIFHFCTLNYIFEYMSKLEKIVIYKGTLDEILERVSALLRWGLADEKIALSFKDVSQTYLKDFSFSNIKVRQLVEHYWNKLINKILSDLSRKRKDTSTKYFHNKKFKYLCSK